MILEKTKVRHLSWFLTGIFVVFFGFSFSAAAHAQDIYVDNDSGAPFACPDFCDKYDVATTYTTGVQTIHLVSASYGISNSDIMYVKNGMTFDGGGLGYALAAVHLESATFAPMASGFSSFSVGTVYVETSTMPINIFQNAIDLVSGTNGTVVAVSGAYNEDIVVSQPITINTVSGTSTLNSITLNAAVTSTAGIVSNIVNLNNGGRISDALALVAPGGTVNVNTGTYLGNIAINKAVKIQATTTNVIIEGALAGPTISIDFMGSSTDRVVLDGLTIQSANTSGTDYPVAVSTSSYITIKNSTINSTGNASEGINLNGQFDNITLQNNTLNFDDNDVAINFHPELVSGVNSNIEISSSTFTASGTTTAAIRLASTDNLLITSSTIGSRVDFYVTDASSASTTISNNTFQPSTGSSHLGGLYFYTIGNGILSTTTILNNNFIDNDFGVAFATSSSSGYFDLNSFTVAENSFVNNNYGTSTPNNTIVISYLPVGGTVLRLTNTWFNATTTATVNSQIDVVSTSSIHYTPYYMNAGKTEFSNSLAINYNTQPNNIIGTVDSIFDIQPVVEVLDAYGDPVADGTLVTVSKASGTGTLTGSTTVAIYGGAGLATFIDLEYNKTDALTLIFTSGAASSATSSPVTMLPGVATQIAVETAADGSGTVLGVQSITADQTITGYAITRDQYNNFVANEPATWSLQSKTGGVINGDLVPASTSKSAIFSGNLIGTTIIRSASSSLTTTDSGVITVTAGVLASMIVSPDTATINANQSQTYTAAGADSAGNPLGDITGTTIFSIIEGGHGGSWSGATYSAANAGTYHVHGAKGAISDDTTSLIVNALVVVSSGGGGGGGGSAAPAAMEIKTATTTTETLNQSNTSTTSLESTSQSIIAGNNTIETITNEAEALIAGNVNYLLDEAITQVLGVKGVKVESNKYLGELKKNIIITPEKESAIANFINYGSDTTRKMGAGERAGVLSSYKASFDKLPVTKNEWIDAIKVANGRWTSERSQTAENKAKLVFQKIYKRLPDISNKNDQNAIQVIAYGLRPANRNVKSEAAAIKTFKAIYGYQPKTATAWDTVRAIAYSGAKR